MQSLQKLSRNNLVEGQNFDNTNDVEFCETCVKGKQSRTVFPSTGGNGAAEPLDLVHSDVYGKMNATSLGGADSPLSMIVHTTPGSTYSSTRARSSTVSFNGKH